jgi:hypothetical protein
MKIIVFLAEASVFPHFTEVSDPPVIEITGGFFYGLRPANHQAQW